MAGWLCPFQILDIQRISSTEETDPADVIILSYDAVANT